MPATLLYGCLGCWSWQQAMLLKCFKQLLLQYCTHTRQYQYGMATCLGRGCLAWCSWGCRGFVHVCSLCGYPLPVSLSAGSPTACSRGARTQPVCCKRSVCKMSCNACFIHVYPPTSRCVTSMLTCHRHKSLATGGGSSIVDSSLFLRPPQLLLP